MYCDNCGKELMGIVEFCSDCGTVFDDMPMQQQPGGPVLQPNQIGNQPQVNNMQPPQGQQFPQQGLQFPQEQGKQFPAQGQQFP